jgi:zinc protease
MRRFSSLRFSHRFASSCLISLAAAIGCSRPPPAPPRTVQVALPHVTSRFANGLQLLVAPDPGSELVHVAVRYKVGSSADPAGKAGLAHLVEHATFLARQGGETIWSRQERIALGFNAYTDADATHYFATGRADQLLDLLAIEARRITIRCEQIGEEEFANELAVVRSELRTRARDVPDVYQALLEAAYEPGHPFRRPTIGFDDELAGTTRADVCAFLRDHYAADRAIIVVTGAVTPAKVEAIVGRLFASAPARAAGQVPAVPPPRPRSAQLDVSASVERPTFFAAWLVPPRGHPDRDAIDLALGLMAGAAGELGGWRLTTSSYAAGGVGEELCVLEVEIEEGNSFKEAEMAVQKANLYVRSSLRRPDFSASVFGRLNASVFTLDSLANRARTYADALQRGARGRALLDDLGKIERTTLDDIRAAAGTYLDRSRMIVVRAKPGSNRIDALGAIGYTGTTPVRAGAGATATRAEADRPLVVPMPTARLAGVRRVVLDNGLEVILAPSSTVPAFAARVVFRAGTADDPSGGINAFAAARGLRVEIDWGPMPEWGSYYTSGGRVWRRVGRDVTELGVEGLASWSDSLIGVLGAVLSEGRYDRTWLREMGERLDDTGERDGRDLERALAEAVWGKGSRNARVLGPKVGAIDDLAVTAFRDRYLTARRATLIVTGQFDPEIILRHVRYAFSGLRPGSDDGAKASTPPSARPAGLAIRTIPSKRSADRLLVDVAVAVPVPPSARRPVVRILAQLLDDRAWRIRSELGSAYSTGALLLDEPGGATLGVRAMVNADRAAVALRRIQEDLAALVAGGDDLVGPFVQARRRVVESLLVHGSGARGLAEELADEARRGHRPDRPSDLAAQVAATTFTEVQALAAELLRPESRTIVLRGADETMRAALRGSGLEKAQAGR